MCVVVFVFVLRFSMLQVTMKAITGKRRKGRVCSAPPISDPHRRRRVEQRATIAIRASTASTVLKEIYFVIFRCLCVCFELFLVLSIFVHAM